MENTTGKKDLIINIAFGYFLNIGYEATTVRMICKEANIALMRKKQEIM